MDINLRLETEIIYKPVYNFKLGQILEFRIHGENKTGLLLSKNLYYATFLNGNGETFSRSNTDSATLVGNVRW